MSQETNDENKNSFFNFDEIKEDLKKKIIDKLQDYYWIEQMKLRSKSYIENNGTKTTTVEEVRDYLLADAIKSFPKLVREEITDDVEKCLEELACFSG